MREDIRLIALDLDGTVFTTDKRITDRTLAAVKAALDAGIVVMTASGRQLAGLPKSLLAVPGMRYAMTSNGGAVVDIRTGEAVYKDLLPYEQACQVARVLAGADAMAEYYHEGKSYADRAGFEKTLRSDLMPAWFKDYVKISRIPVDDFTERVLSGQCHIEKFLISFEDMEERERVRKALLVIPHLTIASGNDFNIEVNSETGTKGHTLTAFAAALGISPGQIMAFGDSENDLTMLRAAGHAVAMANAIPEAKAVADEVTLSNDEDGVALVIERLLAEL